MQNFWLLGSIIKKNKYPKVADPLNYCRLRLNYCRPLIFFCQLPTIPYEKFLAVNEIPDVRMTNERLDTLRITSEDICHSLFKKKLKILPTSVGHKNNALDRHKIKDSGHSNK